MINGTTKLTGLLGWPVEHTMSPVIHNTAFAESGLNYVYVPLPVKPADLEAAVLGLKAFGLAGVNVTVPHKIEIIKYLDRLDRSAALVGAVNTVVFENGQAIGYNTDMTGFINSLRAHDVEIAGKVAVLLGAGGAARAVVCGLLDSGIDRVMVGARDEAKAVAFAATFAQGERVSGAGWLQDNFEQTLSGVDIVINCTPLGMYPRLSEEPPLDWERLNAGAVVCDLIYNPATTAFLARAAARSHKTIGGAGMLVEQGAAAFALWTGIEAPRAAMYRALSEAMAAARK